MNTEEKARRYDEALERVREAKQNTESAVTIGILEEIFPELKESEDERMKKELIKFLQECHNIDSGFFSRYCEIPFTQMLAWLEKQGEKSQRIISAEAKEALYNKPALSEEDEVKINRIVACLENLNIADNDILLKDIDWLKSFKERIGG